MSNPNPARRLLGATHNLSRTVMEVTQTDVHAHSFSVRFAHHHRISQFDVAPKRRSPPPAISLEAASSSCLRRDLGEDYSSIFSFLLDFDVAQHWWVYSKNSHSGGRSAIGSKRQKRESVAHWMSSSRRSALMRGVMGEKGEGGNSAS